MPILAEEYTLVIGVHTRAATSSLALVTAVTGVIVDQAVFPLCPGSVNTGFAEAAGCIKEEAEAELPKEMWIPADKVAQAGIDGLAAAKAAVASRTYQDVSTGSPGRFSGSRHPSCSCLCLSGCTRFSNMTSTATDPHPSLARTH